MIRADDDVGNARVAGEHQGFRCSGRSTLGESMQRGGSRIGEPMDRGLRRGQRRIDKRDGVPSARSLRAGLRRARWTGQWSDGETWRDRKR